MTTITVDIQEAVSMLQKLSTSTTGEPVRAALEDATNSLAQQARGVVPVKTGNLRDSIQVTDISTEGATVEAGADYAAYVELGTFKMSARPYMFPSIPAALQTLVSSLVRAIEQGQ